MVTDCAFERLSTHMSLVMELRPVLFWVAFSLLTGTPDLAQVPGVDPTAREALQAELFRMGKCPTQARLPPLRSSSLSRRSRTRSTGETC